MKRAHRGALVVGLLLLLLLLLLPPPLPLTAPISSRVAAQVIELLEGDFYGPAVMLPETEVVFGYTLFCAADLSWGSDPCPLKAAAAPPAGAGPDSVDETSFFNFAALGDLGVDAEASASGGAVVPLTGGTWALWASVQAPWNFDGTVAVRASTAPPSESQPFVVLGSQPVEIMRFTTPFVERIYAQIKVTNGYSAPATHLLQVRFRVGKVR